MATTGPETFASLREQLFGRDLCAGAAEARDEEVLGVVVELGMPGGTALVFGLRDGSASMYLSSGGGAIGSQQRPAINAAAKRLVETAQRMAAAAPLPLAREHPLPAAGWIRFSILTPAGVRAAEVAEVELLAGKSALTPLFLGAHQIITAFRLIEEGAKPNEPLYVNLLLTALARGHAAAVTLTAGAPLPEPASLTNDAHDLDWLAAAALDLGAQSSERVVNLLLEAGGFRRFHLRKTEGLIRTSLRSQDGASAADFDFRVEKQRTDDGHVRIVITPVRD